MITRSDVAEALNKLYAWRDNAWDARQAKRYDALSDAINALRHLGLTLRESTK